MSLFRERGVNPKLSMTRFVMFGLLGLAYIAVWKARDAATVSSIIVGGIGTALAKVWSDNKDGAQAK